MFSAGRQLLASSTTIAALLAASLGGVSAHAAPGAYCNSFGNGGSTVSPVGGAVLDGIAVGNFEYRGSASLNCYGVDTDGTGGNPTNLNTIGAGAGAFNINNWTELVKFDFDDYDSLDPATASVTKLALGIDWTLTYGGLISGFHEYTLSADDNAPPDLLPATMDLLGALKQGSPQSDGGYAAYFFDGATVALGNDVGKFKSVFGPGNPGDNAWSNLSIWGANFVPDPNGGGAGNGNGNGNNVPEPATLALVGLGLLGAAVARRRQRT